MVATSSGDAQFTGADGFIVTDDADGAGDPPVAHVFAGGIARITPFAVFSTPREGGFPFAPMVMQLRLRGGRWVIVPGETLLGRAVSFGTVSCDSAQRRR